MSADLEAWDRFARPVMFTTSKMAEIIANRTILIDGLRSRKASQVEWFFQAKLRMLGRSVGEVLGGEMWRFDPLTEENCRFIANARADDEIARATGTLDAAAIVFSHAVFEELIHGMFDLDYEENPNTWEDEIGKRTIDTASALTLSAESLRSEAWSKIRQDISRKDPLRKNIHRLMERCKARRADVYERIRGSHRMNLEDLTAIDELRQELVHRPQKASPIPETNDVLNKLASSTTMIVELTGQCLFGLDIFMAGLTSMSGHYSS